MALTALYRPNQAYRRSMGSPKRNVPNESLINLRQSLLPDLAYVSVMKWWSPLDFGIMSGLGSGLVTGCLITKLGTKLLLRREAGTKGGSEYRKQKYPTLSSVFAANGNYDRNKKKASNIFLRDHNKESTRFRLHLGVHPDSSLHFWCLELTIENPTWNEMRAICGGFSVITIKSVLAIREEIIWFLAWVISFPINKIAKEWWFK